MTAPAGSVVATQLPASRRVPSKAPLAGFPLAVHDVIRVAGVPVRGGSRVRAGLRPERRDAAVVAKLRRSGAVVVGTTVPCALPIRVTGRHGHETTPAQLPAPGRGYRGS